MKKKMKLSTNEWEAKTVEDWSILKEKVTAARSDALKGQLGSGDAPTVEFLQGTLMGLEGVLTLMQQLEDREDS